MQAQIYVVFDKEGLGDETVFSRVADQEAETLRAEVAK